MRQVGCVMRLKDLLGQLVQGTRGSLHITHGATQSTMLQPLQLHPVLGVEAAGLTRCHSTHTCSGAISSCLHKFTQRRAPVALRNPVANLGCMMQGPSWACSSANVTRCHKDLPKQVKVQETISLAAACPVQHTCAVQLSQLCAHEGVAKSKGRSATGH